MKPTTFLLLLFLCACTLFGGQVAINEKSIVAYEGSGVSKEDAHRLGYFLLKQGYFNTFDHRTVYLRKQDKHWEVTFIINKELFESDKENLLPGFVIWQQWISEEVFPNTQALIILADESKQPLDTVEPLKPTYR